MKTIDKFECLQPGARIEGVDPSGPAEILQASVQVRDAIQIVFRANAKVGERLVFRGERQPSIFWNPASPLRSTAMTPTCA